MMDETTTGRRFPEGRRRFLRALASAAVAGPLHAVCKAAAKRPFVVAGYLPWYRLKSWSAERTGLLTDLIYFGIKPPADGNLDAEPIDRATLRQLQAMKKASGCRLHLCVGGGDRSEGFASLTGSNRRRRIFVQALSDLCRRAGFDGVDYDWEHPVGEAQLTAYRHLVVESRRALGARRVVSIAQSPWRDYGRAMYDAVDRVHAMSYNHKYPQARLVDAEADIERMLQFGCPRRKLVLGIPFYGRNRKGRSRMYSELAVHPNFDPGQDLLDGFAFNGRETIRRKVRLARSGGLAGVMVWEIGQDTAAPETSLLQAIADEVG